MSDVAPARPKAPRGFGWWFVRGLVAAVLLVVVGVPTSALVRARNRLNHAKASAAELCAAYPTGAKAEGVEDRAKRLELPVRRSEVRSEEDPTAPPTLTFEAEDGFMTDVWSCTITARSGVVVRSNVAFRD